MVDEVPSGDFVVLLLQDEVEDHLSLSFSFFICLIALSLYPLLSIRVSSD